MNSRCPIIEIFPSTATLFADGDGRIILDVDDRTSVSLDKTLRVEDDVYTIGEIDDIVLSIPHSPKNFLYLKKLFDPNVDNPVGVHVESRITVGSNTFIFDRLYAVKKSNTIDIRFTHSESWVTALKNLKLNTIDLGTLDFTKSNIESRWANNSMYNDGDDGYWFPMVDYGGWREATHHMMVVEDLRPWVHSLYVIQKMFDHIGWCVEFPFYETELGRRSIDYLLKSDYGDSQALRNQRRFTANTGIGNFFNPGQLTGWNETYDPGNSFDATLGRYSGVGQMKFILRITHLGTVIPPGEQIPTVSFTIYKFSAVIGGSTGSIIGQINVTTGFSPGDHTLEIETSVNPNDYIVIEVHSNLQNFFGDDISGAPMSIYFSNEVRSTYHQHGDVINIAAEIDPDITAWDYLMGNVHICQGIVIEKPVEKIIRILTPFNADIFGDEIEGYFDNTLVSLVTNQPNDTTHSNIKDQMRYLNIAFAKSTDEFIKKLNAENGVEFYSKIIDLGEPLFDTEEIFNPLFEPTVLDIESIFIHLEDVGAGLGGYYLPQLIDNDKGEISVDIKPRKLIAYGYGTQGDGTARIVWEALPQVEIAFAALISKNISGSDIQFEGIVPEMRLVYGDVIDDLWSLVLGRFLTQFRARIRLDALAYFSHKDFFGLSLRNLFEIEYDGHPVAGRILSIGDWRACENIASQFIFIPEVTVDKYCVSDTPTINCINNPIIISTLIDNCWTFAVGGEFECNIVSLIWEVQYESDDPTVWTPLGSGDTVQVCDASEYFIVRVTIGYDCEECPDSIITDLVYPCENSISCILTQVFFEGAQWLAFSQTGSFANECEFEYILEIYTNGILSDTLEGPFGPSFGFGLTLITEITNNAFYVLTINVTCPGGCPDVSTQCSFTGQDQPGTCEVFPILECVPVDENGVTCYQWQITGEQAGEYETFIVTWNCLSSGEIGTWMPGDPPVCCSGIISAHAIVFYCDCPSVCTEIVECEPSGCSIFNSGVWNPIAVCN